MSQVPLPGEPPVPADRDIDVRYYLGLLWRYRSFLGACALVGLLLGLVVALVQEPEYRAGVLLQIEPPAPTFMSVTDALVGAGGYWQNTDFYNTQFKVLRSKGLGEKVVDKLKLTDREPFKSSTDTASLFMSHVGVEPVPESRLAMVTVTHRDPKEAALWANTLAEVYIEQTLSTRVESARKAYEWLQERLAATQQDMRQAQDRFYQNLRSQDLFVPEGSVSAVYELHHQAQRGLRQRAGAAHRDRGRDQAGARHAAAGGGARLAAPGRGRPHRHRLQHPARVALGRPRAARREVQGRPPRGPEDQGPGRAAPAREARAGRADPRRPQRAVRAAAPARGRAARRHRPAEVAGGEPEPQGHRARRAQEGGRLGQEPLRGPPPEDQGDGHRRLHPQQQRDGGRPRDAAGEPGAAAEAADRAHRPRRRAPRRPRDGPRPRLPREHDPRPRGDRALPAPRPPRRGAAVRAGGRLARDRGLPEPAHGAPLRPARRRRPGGARHRHGAAGGEDDDDHEPRPPPRRLGRAHGGRRLRPAPRAAAPARPACRASRGSPTCS